jgi:uncharacterized protein YjdB
LEIKVEPAEMTLCVGEEKQLKATVTGKWEGRPIFQDVPIYPIWTSDYPNIVEIKADQSGKIRGKAISQTGTPPTPAQVTVHAKVSESSPVKEGTAQVTVNCFTCPVGSIEVRPPGNHTVLSGEIMGFEAVALDPLGNEINIDRFAITWSSSNMDIASVIMTGGPFTAIETFFPGTATITAK